MPIRKKLPDERPSITNKFSVGGVEGYFTVGLYPDTHEPGELFIKIQKEGSTISGFCDCFALSVSLNLQYGVPLKKLVEKFTNSRFEPQGFTRNNDIPQAKSIVDYIFQWLSQRFLSQEDYRDAVDREVRKREKSEQEKS